MALAITMLSVRECNLYPPLLKSIHAITHVFGWEQCASRIQCTPQHPGPCLCNTRSHREGGTFRYHDICNSLLCMCSRLLQPLICRRPYLWPSRPCQTQSSPLLVSPTLRRGPACWTLPLPLLKPTMSVWSWPTTQMLTVLQQQKETGQQVLVCFCMMCSAVQCRAVQCRLKLTLFYHCLTVHVRS